MDYKVESYLDNSGKHSAFKLPFKKVTQITALISSKTLSYFQNQAHFQLSVYINTQSMRDKMKTKEERMAGL